MAVDKKLIPTIKANPGKPGGAKLKGLKAQANGSQLPNVIFASCASIPLPHHLIGHQQPGE